MASSGGTTVATTTPPTRTLSLSSVPSGVAAPLPVLLVLLVTFAVGCGSLNATATSTSTITTVDPLMVLLLNGVPTTTPANASSAANASLTAGVEASGRDDGDGGDDDDGWFEVFKLVLKASIMLLIIIASICGNLLVIVSVMRVRKLR